MIDELVQKYREGAISDYQLVVDCLHLIDPEHPGFVMGHFPVEAYAALLDYATRYDARKINPEARIVPAPDQVHAAVSWIHQKANVHR